MYAQPHCVEWYCKYLSLLLKNVVFWTSYDVCSMRPMIDSRFLFHTLFASSISIICRV